MVEKEKRWWALYVLCAGELMIVLDTTVVNVALPSIRESLGFSEASLVWVVNAYMLTYGGFCCSAAPRRLFGHRRLFLHGIALFRRSPICGFANSQWLLITARGRCRAGGAVVRRSRSLMSICSPRRVTGRRRCTPIRHSAGGASDMLASGVLTSALSWHRVFLINIPIGIAVYAPPRARRDGRGSAGGRLDFAGRGDRDRVVDARGLRHRQQQSAVASGRGAAARGLPLHRIAGCRAAHAAALLARAQPGGGERRRRALGGVDVRLVLHLGAAHAELARLHAAADRPRLPAVEPDHGGVLARALGES
jgi:MFS family permease